MAILAKADQQVAFHLIFEKGQESLIQVDSHLDHHLMLEESLAILVKANQHMACHLIFEIDQEALFQVDSHTLLHTVVERALDVLIEAEKHILHRTVPSQVMVDPI